VAANFHLKVGDINPRRYPSNGDHALASRARSREAIVHHQRVLRVGEVEPVQELRARISHARKINNLRRTTAVN
jgi:hypothetical protein